MRDELERKKSAWDMGYDTKELVRRAFRKIVDSESVLEMIRQRLSQESVTVSIRKAFDELDWMGRGFLTANEFCRAYEA